MIFYSKDENEYANTIYKTFVKPALKLGSQENVSAFKNSHSYGSTDVGDVSWVVPTAGIRTATWVPGTAAHSWQAVASGRTSIGLKGTELAAKTIAATAVEIFNDAANSGGFIIGIGNSFWSVIGVLIKPGLTRETLTFFLFISK